ncbi:hypothetical protein ABZ741_04660 [Streptomyces globisporus]|uniref:zinc finger domain-containing protein n=1 Tax=Streptomyces globisporus TaxID=1908 RepID=UPI003461050C
MTGAPRPAELRRNTHPGLAVPCARCGSGAGRACVVPATGRRMPEPHPSRTDAAAERAA